MCYCVTFIYKSIITFKTSHTPNWRTVLRDKIVSSTLTNGGESKIWHILNERIKHFN